MTRSVKTLLVAAVVAACMTMPISVFAAENPLLSEMMLLNKAYRDIVSAVALEDAPAVVKAVESFQETWALQMTEDALKADKIKTPKNPDKMKEFERMDAGFHETLEALLEAAKAGRQPRIRSTTKKLLDGCIKCHEMFRK